MKKQGKHLLGILLTLVMLLGLLAAGGTDAEASSLKYEIDEVTITVDRPIEGEPLSNCVPTEIACDISYTWNIRGRNGLEPVPVSTIAQAGTTYYLVMELTPKIALSIFADSVTGTVNGSAVTVARESSSKVSCMVRLTPKTKAAVVDVSVPQPANGATPGTPTAAGGRTVTEYKWYRNHPTGLVEKVELGEGDVFTPNYTYWMEATVKGSSNEVFDENTAVTVNGQVTMILSRDLDAKTITFRYDVTEILTMAANIYVPDGSGGSWHLTHGDTETNGVYTASYVSGVLTLTNTGDSSISGVYNKSGSELYYGIYADGDLTLHVDGNFHFDLSETPDTASQVYGIYTVGDLTLVNISDSDCTVSLTPAEGVLATHGSSGIYCEIGSLTVENEGGGNFTLNAGAVGVRLVEGRVSEGVNFTNNGIYAEGSITIGNGCTVNATAADVELSSWGTTTSRGIYADRNITIGTSAVVTADGGNINPSQSATNLNLGNYQYCYGVHVRAGVITVNGGTLVATGGNVDHGTITGAGNMGLGQECYGIYCGGSGITLNGGTITAAAGYSCANDFVESSLSEGIFCGSLTVGSGTLTAIANDAWLKSTGLWVQGVLKQTGGTITGTGGVAVCLAGKGDDSKGIYVTDTLTASGGSLTGTGGTMGIQKASVGLQAGRIELSGTAQVAGYGGLTTTDTIETPVTGTSTFASYPGDSIGVWTFDDLEVDGGAVLTATGGTVRGNRYSPTEAESVGLYIIAEAPTIRGSGKIVATGGETHYGGKGNNHYDSSYGIYGEASSLTIDGTTVIATGGDVSTKTVSGTGVTKGGVSYGLYLPGSSLTLQNGAELTATGGDNPTYSDNNTQKSEFNDSYGAYITGDITVTDSVFTATGGLSIRTVGLYNGGAVTLSGLESSLTASADDYYSSAPNSEKYSYGAMNGGGNDPGGDYTVNSGVLLLQGQSSAINYVTKTLTAPTIQCSTSRDGSNAVNVSSPASLSVFYSNSRRYVKADGSSVAVTIRDWTYGDAGYTPSYTTYEGEPDIRWTGTTRAGVTYSSEDAPTEAGSYTVTVTYPGGQTGSADFTVAPRAITACSSNLKGGPLTYDGTAQTMGVTVKYGETELVEGTDYTISGNTQTNAGQYDITVTGIGNFTGTKTSPSFYIQKASPKAEHFNIPTIGEYTYTGETVELPLPTLKEPMTGIGEITLNYSRYSGDTLISAMPRDAGEYEVKFQVFEGDNFLEDGYTNGINYGTLVIQKGANPMTLLRDSITLPRGGSIDIGKFVANAADSDGSLEFEIVGENECATASSLNRSTLTAGNVTGEFRVRIYADGSPNYNGGEVFLTVSVSDTVAPIMSGTVDITGASAEVSVTVENYFYEDASILFIAQYSGGQMKAVQTVSVTMNGTFAPAVPFAHEEGCTYRAFLLDAEGYVPLADAAPLAV